MITLDSTRNRLSGREEEVLKLASNGLTDRQIAATLGIKVSTVTTYWIRIRSKVGQFNRTELVAQAIRQLGEAAVGELKDDLRRARRDLILAKDEIDLAWEISSAVDFTFSVLRPDGSVAYSNARDIKDHNLSFKTIEKPSGQWKLGSSAPERTP